MCKPNVVGNTLSLKMALPLQCRKGFSTELRLIPGLENLTYLLPWKLGRKLSLIKIHFDQRDFDRATQL